MVRAVRPFRKPQPCAEKTLSRPWAYPKDYIPCYWAGYHDRTAFYIRDFAHQAAGAEYLGYHEENYRMLKCFVEGACEETGWYAPWAFNFDSSVYYMDTPNYHRFVRELTAQYELVETVCRLYALSGDKRYADSGMINFCQRTLNEFTQRQDGVVFSSKNGIPEGKGNIWMGSTSYNENGVVLAEAGDSIAALYKALQAYGGMCETLGNRTEAEKYFSRARELKDYFNNVWSLPPDENGYVFGLDKNGKKYWRWEKTSRGIIGAETCFFMPMKQLTEPGERNNRLLDEIHRMAANPKTGADNIESYTYLPQVFFPYYQPERAWYWMKYIGDRRFLPHIHKSQGLNEDYPELSFTMISSAIEGLMGFSANVPRGQVSTCPCLPKEIEDISMNALQVGNYKMHISYSKTGVMTLENLSESPINWKCGFPGQCDLFLPDGETMETRNETVNGVKRTFGSLVVQPGRSAQVHMKR